jgi:thiol:disulfide interchange protein DsbD
MKQLRILVLLSWGLCLLPSLGLAQISGLTGGGRATGATLDHRLEPAQGVAIGETITLLIQADISPGFHIYSANQVEAAQGNASIFELDPESKDIELVGPLDDRGERETHFDDIFEYEVSEFYGAMTFVQTIKITGPNPRLVGYLRYQICDESMCIPTTYELDQSLPLAKKKINPAPTTEASGPEALTPAPKEPTPAASADDTPEPADVRPATLGPGLEQAVSWQSRLQPQQPRQGDTLRLTFAAQIAPGYHVFSSIPPAKPAGLPTTFNLNGKSQGVELLGDLREYGQPEQVYDATFGTDVLLFHDSVRFEQLVLITGESAVIDGYLSYQVCDPSRCISQKVTILQQLGDARPPQVSTTAATADENPAEANLAWLMLQGFLFGLASIFTPCIFPMIPLTVSFFTKQGTDRKGVRNAIFYGLSIIAIYTGLALLISVLFGQSALQEISNHPGFNVFFFLLLFIFSLSFLGMFEITLPSSWSTKVSKGGDKGGLAGIFLMALALAIVSFSCTGPLVATALGNATRGAFFAPAMTMFAFSLALALPFMLLAIFPRWLQNMPRSGGWLNAVKVSLGLVELALALIYLSRADLVMHWGLLDRDIFIGAWVVIFAMLGLYLLGKLQLPHDSPIERIPVPRFLMAMGSFWFVMYLIPGLWGAPLAMLGGFLPSNTHDMGVLIHRDHLTMLQGSAGPQVNQDICSYPDKVSGHLSEDSPLGFCAFYDLEQGLAYAREVNKPVFLDFTGHTCANCRYLEKNAWVDPDLRRLITEEFVLISLYTDDQERLPAIEKTASGKKLRTVGDKWIQHEIDTYGSNAQPLYVLLDHDQTLLAQPTGFSPPLDVAAYRDLFEAGLTEFRSRHGE